MNRPSLSIGIEEEYQTIDPETRDLRSHIASEILPKAKLALQEAVKPEMHQSVIEVGTEVCKDIKEARQNIQSSAPRGDHAGQRARHAARRRPARIRFPTGRCRRFIPTSATTRWSRTCS